ncbi:MAG: InlB B-repeat-containing protein [Spirochaetaceae bacterium]|jgi:uncharacterized repeat protein (TIGR02543 family)|nr:InlB B-repeat-containing protein [Spirochaetaceae bacterium]
MKKTVYGVLAVVAAFVLGAGFFACDTGNLNDLLGNNSDEGDGPVTVTLTFTLEGVDYTKSVAKGSIIDDGYVANNKNDLGGATKFAVDGLSLNLAGPALTVNADTVLPLVWRYNGGAVETWRTVTFTVNDVERPVRVPNGASLTAEKQAELETFLGAPAGSLNDITWADLSNITEAKAPSAIKVITYTVTFDLDYAHENKTTPQEVVEGASVTTLPEPEREGFRFEGWFTGQNGAGAAFSGDTEITANITVYANWTWIDVEPPAEVTGLAATPGNAQVVLAWTDPADADLASLEITWTPGGETPQTVAKGAQTYTVPVDHDTLYTFTVKTIDTAENKSAGASVEIKTLDFTGPKLGTGGAFLYTSVGSGEEEVVTPVAGTTEQETLEEALTWLETNALADTHYAVQIDEDYAITSDFVGKSDVTGLSISLRSEAGKPVHVTGAAFTIPAGNTLILDKNVVIGSSTAEIADSPNVFTVNGTLEMLPGSKIKNNKVTTDNFLINVKGKTASPGMFYMRGGVIENNTLTGSSVVRVDITGATLEMFDGARIANNKVWSEKEISGVSTTDINTARAGTVAAVVIGTTTNNKTGTFIMHGGEISGTNYRGVYVVGYGSAKPGTFTMEGGTITNNGKSTIRDTTANKDFYVWGGGVFAGSAGIFRMSGGAITNNGNETDVGSGLYFTDAAYEKMFLCGPVNFDGNMIYARIVGTKCIFLDAHFANAGTVHPIPLEVGTDDSIPKSLTDCIKYVKGQILSSTSENGANLATAKDLFTLVRLSYGNSSVERTFFGPADFETFGIDGTGKLVLIEKE